MHRHQANTTFKLNKIPGTIYISSTLLVTFLRGHLRNQCPIKKKDLY